MAIMLLALSAAQAMAGEPGRPYGYAGSLSCRECHAKFYSLWSTSRHGLAMQPYTRAFADKELSPQKAAINIENSSFRFDAAKGMVVESFGKNKKQYPIKHVMGGKYVYFFLTPLERGRLQVLPISYDARSRTWYDTTASFVRHLAGTIERPVHWKDPLLTFNTACHGCHVSQSSVNYHLGTDSYETTWSEPGINCETCHGPSEEHNRLAKLLPAGQILRDPKIISARKMTPQQRDASCAACHTKAMPITAGFVPGERYFDHFDLITLENPDFYPDGRDLGENYTYTLYMMSPCVKSGKLECLHCHTSSGRYRFKQERFNEACMPCHEKYVKNPSVHTHHKEESEGSKCVSCHMPKTEFAKMDRSDHSIRPPMPSATASFGSPNACNICHKDKSADWADKYVREWRTRDFQSPVVNAGRLIEAGRKGDWTRIDEMLAYIRDKGRDEVCATSLIRLLAACRDDRKWPELLAALDDPSPLVRAAAAEALQGYYTDKSIEALLKATTDEYRLVRIRAASSLASIPVERLPEHQRQNLKAALTELDSSFASRPDDYRSHFNLGNYRMRTGNFKKAVDSFDTAIRLRPDAIMPLVNSSIAYANMGDSQNAERSLQKALAIDPENAPANLNLGLLLAESGRIRGAEKALRTAFTTDPKMAQAAYNLCVILAGDRLDEAIGFCAKASEVQPDDPKYAYTLAFYLHDKGRDDEAVKKLEAITEKHPEYRDAQELLKELSDRSR
jgi:tetratricopeptide (TPR) repeat protein